jgi:xanthine dehydrogenase small subunit
MRDCVRFLLGDHPRELRGVDPTRTVLDYLRTHEHRKGTKEGCAEGDCGACTVVLARPDGEGLRYEAVNACIQLLPTLDGAQLLTVEDLKGPDGALHPVQRALVERHGSQCGFCTPGFVMSLFPLWQRGGEPTVDEVCDTLAGNLCRCTGYGPIIEAARLACRSRPERDDGPAARILRQWDDDEPIAVEHQGRRYLAPTTLDGLARAMQQFPGAVAVAGSTDVGLWVTKQHRVIETVVFTGRVKELQRIEETADAIEIGAGVSLTRAMTVLAAEWPDMGEVYRRFASPPIRNAATLGGNIANGSPIGDSAPMLIAAGATLVLRRGAQRRTLPLEAFFIDYGRQDRQPDELVEKVIVPRRPPDRLFRAYKISKRFDQDISAVLGAFALRLEDGRVAEARIAFGGMAATPKRASALERALHGQPWRRETIDAAVQALPQDLTPITDMRASAGYRMRVAQNLLLKCFVETAGGDSPTRLAGERGLAHV